MHTLSKQQVGQWVLLDYLSQWQMLESKIQNIVLILKPLKVK